MATNVNPTAVGLSNNTDIDGILWGWRWGTGINTSNAPLNLTYSFPTATTEYTNGGTSASPVLRPLTQRNKQRSRQFSRRSRALPICPLQKRQMPGRLKVCRCYGSGLYQ